ncbi:hypothetical protein GGP66_003271 [Salinibacter ruber]|nr:hypothetical protein [Salinibacter ruber]
MKRSSMLAQRSRFRYFSGKASAAGRLVEAGLKCPKGRRRLLFEALFEVVESGSSLFLSGGFQDLVEHLVHLVSVVGGRLVQDVPPEVRLTPLPDEAWEALLKGLFESFVRVAGCQLHAGEPSLLETTDKPAPSLLSLAEGHLKPENLPLAVLADADRQHCGRPGRTAF